jgi:hypothetical protein
MQMIAALMRMMKGMMEKNPCQQFIENYDESDDGEQSLPGVPRKF